VLFKVPLEDLRKHDPALGIAIARLRSKQFHALPGYDGEYGKISIFEDGELEKLRTPQMSLF
jgi:DNA helicase-2/ATP-dependent DNA helicase PcrA